MRMSILRYTFKHAVFKYTCRETKHTFSSKIKLHIPTHKCREKNSPLNLKFQRDAEHQQLHKTGCEEIILLKFCCKISKKQCDYSSTSIQNKEVFTLRSKSHRQSSYIQPSCFSLSCSQTMFQKTKQLFGKKNFILKYVLTLFMC